MGIVGLAFLVNNMAQGCIARSYHAGRPVNLVGSPISWADCKPLRVDRFVIGAAGIYRGRNFFCNGANLAYRKQAFTERRDSPGARRAVG